MSLASLEKQLIARVQEEQRRWQDIAVLLMRVKGEGLWQGHASSFTGWVEGLARRADLQASVFWRCLNAGRIYLELTGDEALDPAARDLKISAESLELADKIRRHAPKAIASEVLTRTLDGAISRAELRGVWDTYRLGNGGVTARGRLPDDPALREEALVQRASAWEAQKRKPESRAEVRRGELLSAFRAGGWLGEADQGRTETKLPALEGRVAAVLVARRKADHLTRVELHGVWTAVSVPELKDFVFKAPAGIDFMWLAVPTELQREAVEHAPRLLGVLELRRDRALHVVRGAQQRPQHAEGRVALLSTLLQSAYLWPSP